jgi:hypothetical protein
MIEKITAVIAAAACAGVIVTLVPGFAPEIAAHASPPADRRESTVAHLNKPMGASAANAAGINTSVCEQTWPYYGRSCLVDANRTTGNVRVVRMIDLGRSAAPPMRDTRRQSQTRIR